MTRDGRIEAAVRQAKAAVAGANGSDRRDGDDEGQSEKTLAEEIVQIKDAITQEAQGAIDEMQGALASVWIGQMRFARRSEVSSYNVRIISHNSSKCLCPGHQTSPHNFLKGQTRAPSGMAGD